MHSTSEPIAIVGSGCRFPGGASSPSKLWKLLEEPTDACDEIPSSRFETAGFFHPDGSRHGHTNVRHAYLMQNDIRAFDSDFFNISPNEASSIDPQQRLLLETVYEAMEAGGHAISSLSGSDTAVYVGTMGVDYNDTLLRDLDTIPTYFATGTNRAIISNRISYFFNWHGPSMTIDTACSSSLVAVHQGVQSLRSGESSVAIACGTQVILGPEVFIFESKMKMLSPTGRSRMWDAGADGYARGEGVAAIVLKRLSDAIRDGDHIECIIRETGTNQDGFSNGITVPSTEAQAALIRQTYARAGLDLAKPEDRPQFFEAHGTGTQAGDPKEAAAIAQCFGQGQTASNPLYVGSVKTVIGHTEGAAGLAGLLKGMKSIQAGQIAPNLLFEQLSPKIEPFYQGLKVPTSLTPWPKLAEGVPRRVSINSFGFGGSNAHAILEQYIDETAPMNGRAGDAGQSPMIPFLFSAVTEASLLQQISAIRDHLDEHPETKLRDLAWTLRSRRSQFGVKLALSADSLDRLISKIDAKLEEGKKAPVGIRAKATSTKNILGVFTGQGAQYAAMGAELIQHSEFAARRVQELEDALSTLPPQDRPSWSLRQELLASAETSRIGEARLSQPLCTALQVVLVDILRTAGIDFRAVVGHSSGEIGAAYAAGYLSASDAIRVAYFRGVYAKLAGNAATGQKGAMMAVGTSLEDAEDLLSLRAFKGRISIAAHNSSASVTLSGDADAIEHAKKVFDEEKKFARLLKVDTAYHSHHMAPCGQAYIDALNRCGVVAIKDHGRSCDWFSSVFPSGVPVTWSSHLANTYWKDNMAQTVLFADAVKQAATAIPDLDFILEIGPHPALQGPATQNISDVRPSALPYSGVLSRGTSSSESFPQALGNIWSNLGTGALDLDSVEECLSPDVTNKLVTGLPSYRWNHSKSSLFESRKSRKMRGRTQQLHEILGQESPDSSARDRRWHNVLKVSEIPWLSGHQLQGQSVFPAAGYVALAIESMRALAKGRSAELFEVHNLSIPRAITFEDDPNFGVETQVTLTQITPDNTSQCVTADFSCYSCPANGTDAELELMASASVKVVFGSPSPEAIFANKIDSSTLTAVDTDRFYEGLGKLGYGYYDHFRSMTSLKRRFNQSSVMVDSYAYTDDETTTYLVHPTWLDVAFQGSMLAYSAPGDERLWSLHVPTSIAMIRVNPDLCASLPHAATVQLPVCSDLAESETFCANIDVYNRENGQAMVQVEELTIKPFAPATAADDRQLFSATKWDPSAPDGVSITKGIRPSSEEVEIAHLCERLSYHYLRKWKSEISDDDWAKGQAHHAALRSYMDQMLRLANTGKHPCIKSEWATDSDEDIKELLSKFPGDVDLRLLSAVGEAIPAAVRGDTTILEHMLPNNLLDDYYKYGLGFAQYNSLLASMMKQITHRYPHTKILEIGAGTGGATRAVLDEINGLFSSYTYTDISVGFFEKAAQIFHEYNDRMVFKTLDIEKAPTTQGYEKEAYDIVIASNVLHATSSMEQTLKHTRQLLKPGGYLMLLELTNNGPTRFSNVMGGLTGWWAGVNDGRQYAPTMEPGRWQTVLRSAGFSGIEAITPEIDGITWPFSIMAAQATDERVDFLRRPLTRTKKSASSIALESLVILGGDGLETSRLAEEISEHLDRHFDEITTLSGLPTEDEAAEIAPMSTFINLVDLDTAIFEDITDERISGLNRMYELAKHTLWVTVGAVAGTNPYHMASVSFSRAMSHEAAHINMNHLDVNAIDETTSRSISEHILRQCALDEWQETHNMFWSREPEVLLDERQWKVPRLVDNAAQNARLNSSRRRITRDLAATETCVAIETTGSSISLVEEVLADNNGSNLNASVTIESSTVMALGVEDDCFLFLGMGKDVATSQSVLTLSTINASKVAPVVTIPCPPTIKSSQELHTVAIELLACSALRSIVEGDHLLVHSESTDSVLAQAIAEKATLKKIRTSFVCDRPVSDDSQSIEWRHLDARSSLHILRTQLSPLGLSHYLDLAASSILGTNIAQVLPETTRRLTRTNLGRKHAHKTSAISEDVLSSSLQTIINKIIPTSASNDAFVTDLADLDGASSNETLAKIATWPQGGMIKVSMRPLHGAQMFSSNKSYLLVGLSGQIGRSLCEWMINNGAGCVCLTSRNPEISQTWLESFKYSGGTVKIFAADVTKKDDLLKVVNEIQTTCPPIAGVANGAMVLKDILFSNMTAETMNMVLRPKIIGSNHLDDIFYQHDLDFFVLFSSSASIIGNSGQSNYAAANGYLNGLAKQRRARGLAASVVDIGRVAGIGYVETAGQAVLDQLTRFGLMAISEADFRQVFAETILAGSKDQTTGIFTSDPIVTTGIRKIRDDEEIGGPWFENPRFSHCIIETKSSSQSVGSEGKKNTAPVIEQVAAAGSKTEALAALQECFFNRMRLILQLGDATIDPDVSLVELGVDSLVAVEVRSWFLKELKVDVPVLKIVGGIAPAELCALAIDKLPEEMFSGKEESPQASSPGKVPAVKGLAKVTGADTPTRQSDESSTDGAVSDSESSTLSDSASTEATSGTQSPALTNVTTPATSRVQSSATLPTMKNFKEAVKAAIDKPVSKTLKSGPMSFGQTRFWFLKMLLEDETTSNVAFYYHIGGALRIGDLERAVKRVVTRHEALRTRFVASSIDGDVPMQQITASSPLKLELRQVESQAGVVDEYERLQQTVFDMETGFLMRLVLCQLSPTSHYLLVNYHHIVMDGVSFQVFLSDLEKAYESTNMGKAPGQFLEHSTVQRQAYENGDLQQELVYWESIFPKGEEPPVLPLLPMAQTSTRTSMENFGVHQVSTHLTPATAAAVKVLSRAQRSTPMHFYLAAFKTMLFKLTESSDVCIGIADANRNDSKMMNSIGFFLNLLPLRFRRDKHQSFGAAVAEARDTTYSALNNSRLPFDVLLEELRVPRSSKHSPFFQAFFDYRQGAQEKHPWGNVEFEFVDVHPGRTNYDITLDITESGDNALIMLRLQKSLYDETAADLLLDTMIHLITTFAQNAEFTITDTPLFGTEQVSSALKKGRGPAMISDWPATLPHRIDDIARDTPSSTALVDGIGLELTYKAMTGRIEAIAEALQAANIGSGDRVLVYQTASSDWICSMLAIMRIGAVYVPLDLRNPISRLAAVAQDCQPLAILVDHTTSASVHQVNVTGANSIDISQIPAAAATPIAIEAKADSIAAILYTSGSTGLPKGIQVTHAGLRNEIEGYTKTWELTRERTLQQSAYTFNHSSDQIYTALTTGGTVYTVPWEKRGDPIEVSRMLSDHQITYTKATPSEYSLWIQHGRTNLLKALQWRRAFGGGESLTHGILQEFASLDLKNLRLFNSYGPTEISISSTKMEIDYRLNDDPAHVRIPCGFALPNYYKYIVDEDMRPLPIGMPGQLCIGGAGVSRGYLNNAELTEKHFKTNPFATDADVAQGWDRMYLTGDICHLQPDGSMVFHRRMAGDSQVKIRGLRIELGDIESNLVATSNGAIKEAVVTLREGDPGFLVAHVVFTKESSVPSADREQFLRDLLIRLPVPQYMIPVAAFELEALPLTNHSKVDRKVLRSIELPTLGYTSSEDDEELTESMTNLRDLWFEVLGNKELGLQVGPATSFFAVGGNSLLAIRLQARIKQEHDVILRLVDILESSALREMSQRIEQSRPVQCIDWEAETTLPEIPDFVKSVKSSSGQQSGVTVLLTGATGFLSKFLIPALEADPNVARIHCVAVRDNESRPAPSGVKIVSHIGNLASPLLGLSQDTFKQLASEVDFILHFGAVRSFWDNYHTLRASNTQSTKEIVKLASARKIPVHYISTMGVFPRGVQVKAASAAQYVPDMDGAEGYNSTRWASEQILERASSVFGIRTSVYRFLPSTSGASPAALQSHLENFARLVKSTGKLPEMSDWEGRIDLAAAQDVAARLSEDIFATEGSSESSGVVRFHHLDSELSVDIAELRDHLEKRTDEQKLERMPGLAWFGLIKKMGWEYLLTSQQATIAGRDADGKQVLLESRR